jgi:hypothetical protein
MPTSKEMTTAERKTPATETEGPTTRPSLLNRTLAVITDELHAALKRETADILTIGNLLIEAKAQMKHGEWLPWLKKKVSISERSAQKYVKAAEFAAKYELGADLKLSPSALYLLAEDHYWVAGDDREAATQAVLNAAKEGRVGCDHAEEIIHNILMENLKQKDREITMADAMAPDLEKAERETNDRGECWADKKDECIKNWIAKNWGKEQDAKFDAWWQARHQRTPELSPPSPAELSTGSRVERPKRPRIALPRNSETRPRNTAARHRDTRIMECLDQAKRLIGAIMRTVSDPIYDDHERKMLRHEFTPHLDGFIDGDGKRRFDPSSSLMAVGAPEKQANDNTSQPGQDEVA